MGFGSRAFLAGGLGFAAAFAVACGGSNGLLSGAQSSQLAGQVDSVAAALAAHNCHQVASAARALTNAVDNLQSIDPTVQQDLGQGASTTRVLAIRECAGTKTRTTSTKTTSSTSTSTSSTTTTSSTQTSTVPTTNTAPATNTVTTGTSSTPTGGISPGGTQTNGQGQGQ
jgi:hypothetical protein